MSAQIRDEGDEFMPTGVALVTTMYGNRVYPCELYGDYFVNEARDADDPLSIILGVFTVSHLETGRAAAHYSSLKVARNFARWLDDFCDLGPVHARYKSGGHTEEDRKLVEYINQRRRHVAFIDYPTPREMQS